MAGTGKFEDLHLGDLSLEPLPDPGLMNFQVGKNSAEKQAFKGDIRKKNVTDRRITADRRKSPRFEPNRRSGSDRRPAKTWDPSNSQ
jgi:hypothetical protein